MMRIVIVGAILSSVQSYGMERPKQWVQVTTPTGFSSSVSIDEEDTVEDVKRKMHMSTRTTQLHAIYCSAWTLNMYLHTSAALPNCRYMKKIVDDYGTRKFVLK